MHDIPAFEPTEKVGQPPVALSTGTSTSGVEEVETQARKPFEAPRQDSLGLANALSQPRRAVEGAGSVESASSGDDDSDSDGDDEDDSEYGRSSRSPSPRTHPPLPCLDPEDLSIPHPSPAVLYPRPTGPVRSLDPRSRSESHLSPSHQQIQSQNYETHALRAARQFSSSSTTLVTTATTGTFWTGTTAVETLRPHHCRHDDGGDESDGLESGELHRLGDEPLLRNFPARPPTGLTEGFGYGRGSGNSGVPGGSKYVEEGLQDDRVPERLEMREGWPVPVGLFLRPGVCWRRPGTWGLRTRR